MAGTFACPECGAEVTLQGASSAREVRCAECSTWVEVPYLPREGVWTRAKFRKARPSWMIAAGWAGVALLAVVVAIVGAGKYVDSRVRGARDASVAEILKAADDAETAGHPGRALSEVEAALKLLRDGGDARRVTALRDRRDALSVREAEARVAGSRTVGPSEAVGDLLSLQARARTDRALDPIAASIRLAIDAARARGMADDLAAARSAADAGRTADALARVDRALVAADKLDAGAIRSATAEAESIAGPILGRVGVIVEQGPGTFTLGSVASYDAALGPRIADVLRRRGYAPRPVSGPARPLWDRHAPYRLRFAVTEVQEGLYLQSKSRLSEVSAALTMVKGRETTWGDRSSTRTQVPLPDLPAYLAGRLAVSDRREPETERRLYEDARVRLVDVVVTRLGAIPAP